MTRKQKSLIATRCPCCGMKELKSSPAILMPFVAHRAFGWQPVRIDESWGLSTVKKGQAYSICKSMYCSGCGFLFSDIRFSEIELSNLYDDYRGEEYTSLRELYEPGYTRRNDNLNDGVCYIQDVEKFLYRHLRFPITILDWGGDTGKNTPFKNKSEALDIYDISNKCVPEGSRKVSKREAQSKKYNLIVCSGVLEHVPWPCNLLSDLTKMMNKESILYIEVPLEDVVMNTMSDLHLLKKHWHEHINFFSESSIYALVRNVGLEVEELQILQTTAGLKTLYLFLVACKLGSN